MTLRFCYFLLGFCFFSTAVLAADQAYLHEAVKNGDKVKVDALLSRGEGVNAKTSDGMTPLHWAAYYGMRDIVELLISKGADIHARDEANDTPLHKLAYGPAAYGVTKETETIELLLAKGANVSAKNINGWTPLHYSARAGKKHIVVLLITNGADIYDSSMDGVTPLDLAVSRDKKDVIAFLENSILDQAKKNPRGALAGLVDLLKKYPDVYGIRRLVIKQASSTNPRPAIPEEARRHFVEGTTIVKTAKNPEQQLHAVESFKKAVTVAPWWAGAYYNLGVAQELAKKYDDAEKSFELYLLSKPSEKEAREVQDRIYAIGAKKKLGQ